MKNATHVCDHFWRSAGSMGIDISDSCRKNSVRKEIEYVDANGEVSTRTVLNKIHSVMRIRLIPILSSSS